MPTKQFRTAGPMTLEQYSPTELLQVQQAVNLSINDDEHHDNNKGKKIKYLVLNKQGTTLLVYAHAESKMSQSAWRKCLGHRFQNIETPLDKRAALDTCMNNEHGAVFEEYGVAPPYHETAGIVMASAQNNNSMGQQQKEHDNEHEHPQQEQEHEIVTPVVVITSKHDAATTTTPKVSTMTKIINKEKLKRERNSKKWLKKAMRQLRLPEHHIVPIVVEAYKMQSSLFEF